MAKWISLALGVIATVAQAQQAAAPAQQLERVEVTGSSIKRIEGETALPVQVLTREDIQRTGAANVEQLMQTVSAIASSGTLVAASASGATTGGISSISLRGLSSIRTLVLINGRRISPYGIGFTNDSVSVDVNSIPLAAVERVEILKDGASAIYGSDAIAGVVNFILRKDFRGVELTAEYGDTTDGGGKVTRFSGTYGYGDLAVDRFNVMVTASYQKEDPIYGRDRKFASSGIFTGATGDILTGNDVTSGNTLPANFVAADGSFGTRNPAYPDNCGPYSVVSPVFEANGLINRCRFDPSPYVALLPDSERTSIFASARFALTTDIEAFLEASYNKNKIRTIIQPVPISDVFTIPSNNPLASQFPYNAFAGGQQTPTAVPYSTILMTPSNFYYPTAYVQAQSGGPTPDLLIRYRSIPSGNRDLTDTSESPRLTLGVKGTVAAWDFDGAFLHSANTLTETINGGYPQLTKIMPLLNNNTGDPNQDVNFFGPNTPAVQALFDAANYTGRAYQVKTTLDSVAAKGSRELVEMGGGPLAVAVGTELRKEKYDFHSTTVLEQGDLAGYGGNFATVDKSRQVKALFSEVSLPIFKGFETTAAVRYDNYENIGSSTTPKVGLRFQPAREVLFRGSIGRGFRAPSLADLYSPATTGVTPPGLNDPFRCDTTGSGTDCQTQFPVTNAGNAELKPEKSINQTLGVVLEPTSNVSLAVDWFRVRLKDAINNGIPSAFILQDPQHRFDYLITRGPFDTVNNIPGPILNIDQTNLNIGRVNLSGIDVDAKLGFNTEAMGRFMLSLNGTYYTRYEASTPDGSFAPAIDQPNAATGGEIPRWKHRLELAWNYGNWGVTMAQNWQGRYNDIPSSFDDPTDPAFVPRKVGAYETYDLQTTYSGLSFIKFTLGARNIFNRDPPYSNLGGQVAFQAGYDPEYADPRGRFVYGRITVSIK